MAENDVTKNPEAQEKTPEPNIIFVGGEKAPFTKINNGMDTIKLPSAEVQATVEEDKETKLKLYKGIPFYHKDASAIVTLFPLYYKHFKKKG